MHRSPLTRIGSSRNRWLYQYVGFLKVALFVIALSWLPAEAQSSSANTVIPQLMNRYTAMMGATNPAGLTPDLFASGDARWLGVQVENQPEKPLALCRLFPIIHKC